MNVLKIPVVVKVGDTVRVDAGSRFEFKGEVKYYDEQHLNLKVEENVYVKVTWKRITTIE